MLAFVKVSIPSSGSIQFLREAMSDFEKELEIKSQSPQAGQFNSYSVLEKRMENWFISSLNPLKRVNSILT